MQPKNEEKGRFEFKKLEARIAPGAATAGLNTALAAAETAVNTAPQEVVDHVIETVGTNNPEA